MKLAGLVGAKQIKYVITLMSLAMIGLIGLQFYWIITTVSLNKARFKHNVYRAIERVALRIERHEAIYITQENAEQMSSKVLHTLDSLTRAQNENQLLTYALNFEIRNGDRYQHRAGITLEPSAKYDLRDPRATREEYLRKMANKQNIVSIIVEKLMFQDREKPIQQRVSRPVIDSILRQEIHGKGINLDYEFAVFNRPSKKWFFTTPQTSDECLSDEGYCIRLFPNDMSGEENLLCVYFPKENNYIMGKMAMVLSSSVIFIGVIILCFWAAIYTIIRQKKTSEVTNDFINNMTHEFKTPIATISLAGQMLQDVGIQQSAERSNRYLNIIKDESQRLTDQVEKVLQTARLDRQDFKLNIQDVDIHQTIEEAVKNIAIQVESRGGQLFTKLDATQTIVEGDKVHLRNIISNLLDNANKYSPNTPRIEVQTQNTSNGIEITFIDEGQGIPKKILNKIFDKFYRVPTGNVHNVKGFGLGLSYVKSMVEAHGGSISVDSELDKGSTFKIRLPFKQKV